jgi:hypothetical protein|nr:MAG TPA: DNA-packaging protein [Bacteriophage sp.]
MFDKNTVKTESGVEIYEDQISEYLDQYIDEHDIEDMHKEPQSRWNAALLYINKYLFKPHPEVLKSENRLSNTYDLEIVSNICDRYIELCYEYDKEISILGFCKLTGIVQDTIYQWGNETTRLGSSASEIYKKLSTEREESLSNMLISGKRNPVGLLGALNRHYGWNMGQPRGGITEKQQSIEQIQQRYKPAELSTNDTQLAPPKADF